MAVSCSTPRAAGIFLVDPARRGGPAVLLLKRAGWVPKPGTWGTPGGLRDRGERAWDAARRELAEETGLKLRHWRGDGGIPSTGRSTAGPPYVTHGGYRTFVVIVPGASRQRVRLCSENTASAWVPVAGLLRGRRAGLLRGRRPLHPGLRAVLSRLVRMAERVGEPGVEHRARRPREALPGGLARGKSPADFDPRQLRMGIAVEREHLIGGRYAPGVARAMAQEIAMDHLTEIPDYYTRLARMERAAKGKREVKEEGRRSRGVALRSRGAHHTAHRPPSVPASLRRLGFTAASVDHYLAALERTPSGRDAGPRGAPVGVPPSAVRRAALEGLQIRARFPPSRQGGTDIGVGRAIQLVLGGPLPERSVRRMAAYFSRHARDRSPGWDAPGAESKGYQAWLLWGGDAGRRWAEGIVKGWRG